MAQQPRAKRGTDGLGPRVAQVRKARKMSQADLANAIGATVRTLQNYESGRTVLPGPVIRRVASALRVTPDDLMLFETSDPVPPRKG